jgi:uncharacterized protein with GYD domain
MDLNVTTLEGKEAGKVSLSDAIFGLEPREDIIARVVRWQLAKKQQGTHKAKGRAEVARTGAKMFKQWNNEGPAVPAYNPVKPHNGDEQSPNLCRVMILGKFTEQGARNIKESPKREDAFRKVCEKQNVRVKDVYRTMGRYDLAAIVDAPDDVTMSAILYTLGSLGNVRTETLRAFTPQETEAALARVA